MTDRKSYDIPIAGGRVLELGPRPLVMGILNITPDSFADSPHFLETSAVMVASELSLVAKRLPI